MSDPFAQHAVGRTSPGMRHAPVTASDTALLDPRPRVICALTAGTLALEDEAGTIVVYPVTAGQLLPFSPLRVRATGTTATCVGWI